MDEGLNADTVAGYALEMSDMRSEDIHMFTIPTGEQATTAGGAQVILQEESMMELLRRSLRNDNMDGLLDYLEVQEDTGEEHEETGEEQSAEQEETPTGEATAE